MANQTIHHKSVTVGFFIIILSLSVGCVGKGGTTILLRTNELSPPSQPVHGKIALLNEADDSYPSSPTIGEATWSLFRMHIDSIKADPSPKTGMIALAQNSLIKAGYEVRLVSAGEATTNPNPIGYIKIDEFSYEMWSWLWPYVPIFGDTAITMTVKTANGQTIDSRVFRAKGRESCWFGDCAKQVEAAVAQSLTSIMNQIIQWASEGSFRKAVVTAPIQEHLVVNR